MEQNSSISKFILLFFICFCFVGLVRGQQKLNISAGVGIPELFNVGFRYELNENNLLGVSVGSPLSRNENIVSLSGDFFHHFGGKVNLANRKRTYYRIGLGYLREDGYSSTQKYGTLNIRIGWDFSLSPKSGIQMDIGPGFVIIEKEIEKFENDGWLTWDWEGNNIYPSIGITFYHRL